MAVFQLNVGKLVAFPIFILHLCWTRTFADKDQLSLTNPRDALHHEARAANK